MLTWTKKDFSYHALGSLNLHYMGKKEHFLNHRYGPHTLDTYLLIFVLEGSATFRINGQTRPVGKDCFYVMYPHSDISYVTNPDEPWTIQWIVANGEQLEAILDMLKITRNDPFLPISRPDKLKLIYENLFEKVNRIDLSAKMECLSLLYELFALLAADSETASRNRHISSALEYIYAHYTQNISIRDIAASVHLDSNYFSKLFRQELGISPVQYIKNMRFEKAQHLLKYTTLNVTQVAQSVGFSDVLYFSRAFKAVTGFSPSEYRKQTNT